MSQPDAQPNFFRALQENDLLSAMKVGRALLKEFNQQQYAQFDKGETIERLMRGRSLFLDQLLKQAWKAFLKNHANTVALIAVGGYGRQEMQPYSDVDILVVCNQACDTLNEEISGFFTFLWDLGLDVGHATRTIEQCREAGLEDIVTATNLLEARWITGDYALFEAVQGLWSKPDFWPSQAFFETKVEEQRQRHARFHDTVYQLEPNIKESPGGLRDIQTLFWVAKRHFNADSISELVRHRFITQQEFKELESAYYFLNRIRFALHRYKKRHEDRLLFENQQGIAEEFGYHDTEEKLAVEQFMNAYYRTAQVSIVLNEILLQHFSEEIFPNDQPEILPVNRNFQIVDRYLDIVSPDAIERDPRAILEAFIILEYEKSRIKGIRSKTIRAIRSQLHQIDEGYRNDPVSKSLFIEILRQPQGVYSSLKRMHTYGILGAYLPAFQKITGLMQFNIFHAYTVDEHTILVIRNMRRFFIEDFTYEFPTAHKVAKQLCKPELLFLAGLFHDIAKGRGGSHEVLGAEDAEVFCQAHNLPAEDTELVRWLVRHHLDFSDFAQKKDLSDPEEVTKFTHLVKDQKHLDYLYLLTLADVISTSDGVWNDWKNALFLQLYNETSKILDSSSYSPKDRHKKALQHQENARELLKKRGIEPDSYAQLWQGFENTDFFSRQTPNEIARLTKKLYQSDFKGLIVNFEPTTQRGASELMLFMPDRDFLFADITQIIDQANLNIVEAKIYSNYAKQQGMTLVLLYLLDEHQQQITDEARIHELLAKFTRLLSSDEELPASSGNHSPIARRIRCFDTPTSIQFQPKSRKYTLLHLSTKDIPGLLSLVAKAFKKSKIRLHDAKINTIGEKAEDTFLISNLEGLALSKTEQQAVESALCEELGVNNGAPQT
jgi:[protein-PII] uridylyltransferase